MTFSFFRKGKLLESMQAGLIWAIIGAIGVCIVIAFANIIMGKGAHFTQEAQKYGDVTGMTAFVFSFEGGFDIAPLHGDQNLQWNNGEIHVQSKWQMPFADSSVLHGIRRTFWTYVTSNTGCTSVRGYSASFFSKYDVFLDVCGKNIQYRIPERTQKVLNISPVMMRLNKIRSAMVYTKEDNGDYVVGMKYGDQAQEVNRTITKIGQDVASEMEVLRLPPQHILRLSPMDGFAIVLDHTYARRMRVLDVSTMEVTTLEVPGFGEAQIHFSPVFISEREVAFSVTDGKKWATIAYDMAENAYRTISDSFSDQIYPTGNGELLLLQSFVENAGNVPFASKNLQLTRTDTALSDGMLYFLRWNGRDTQVKNKIPFIMEPQGTNYEYKKNIGALLEALGAPAEVISEYMTRSTFRSKNGQQYELIDWL